MYSPKIFSAFTALKLKLFVRSLHKSLQVSLSQRVPQFIISMFAKGVQIYFQSSAEQDRVLEKRICLTTLHLISIPKSSTVTYLRYDGQYFSQVMQTDRSYVDAVDENVSLIRLQNAEQAQSQRGLSSSCTTHDAQLET